MTRRGLFGSLVSLFIPASGGATDHEHQWKRGPYCWHAISDLDHDNVPHTFGFFDVCAVKDCGMVRIPGAWDEAGRSMLKPKPWS